MKPIGSIARKTLCAFVALLASAAFGATLSPITLLNPAGSTSGQAIVSTGSSSAPAWANVSATTLTGILPVAQGGTNCSAASGACLDNIAGFSSTGFVKRTGSGAYSFTTIIPVASGGTGVSSASGTALDNIAGFSSTGYMQRTGAGAYSFSTTIPATSATYTASGTGGTAVTVANMFAQTAFIDSYGAAGDGTTDDSTPLTNAMAALGTAGGVVFLDCSKNYYIGSNVTVPSNVTIRQCQGRDGRGNPGADWATSPIATLPHISLSSSATISMSSNSGFDGIILRSGMTIPVQTPSAYAGTAIKLASSGSANDVKIKALIIGFAACVDGSSGGDRQQWDIECDAQNGTSAGAVIIGPSFDTSRITIRTYPWGTVGYGGGTGGTLTRTGYGTQILAPNNDDTRLDVMDFGHTSAVVSSADGNLHISHIWADNNSGQSLIFNNSGATTIDALWIYTGGGGYFFGPGDYNIGSYFCNTGSVSGATCLEIGTGSNAVWMNIGNLDVEESESYAINVGNVESHVSVGNAIFNGINTASAIAAASGGTSDQIQIGRITYNNQAAGSSLIGGNTNSLPSIASASVLNPPVNYDHFLVTGTTNISTITGTWNDRRIILTFSGALTVNNTVGNLNLTSGDFPTSNGASIALWYNQALGVWFEMWRH